MHERRRVEERLKRKEQEIQALEAQIKDARVYIQALQDVLRLLPRDPDSEPGTETMLRPRSLVAQARAAIAGRDHVIPDDVKALAEATLAHRLILSQTARFNSSASKETSTRTILQGILNTLPVPGAVVGNRPIVVA